MFISPNVARTERVIEQLKSQIEATANFFDRCRLKDELEHQQRKLTILKRTYV